jgi:hypothetical protein
MTDQDQDKQSQQADESKQQKEDQLRTAAKSLKAKGFNNEQIAQQLSAKHQMAAADIKQVLDQDKEDSE